MLSLQKNRKKMSRTLKILIVALLTYVTGSSPAQAMAKSFELPVVPDTLREPSQRAAYVIEHYWDSLDFAADSSAVDEPFVEQAFVDFLSVFPYASQSARECAVSILAEKASANIESYRIIMSLAEKYLFGHDSPMASDDTYSLFLNEILKGSVYDEVHKIRYRAHQHAVSVNRPGTPATDFSFLTRDGAVMTLGQIGTDRDILLIFYDPDCDHCTEVLEALANDEANSEILYKTRVVAVYSGDDMELWQQQSELLPQEWIVGYEDGTMQDNGMYVIRSLPALYLLAPDGTVILKDATPQAVIDTLNSRQILN